MQRYLVHSIENMRDIGGYPLKCTKRIAYGKIIRSNLPIKISEQDIQVLKNMGIKTIIDLRTSAEYSRKISVFENRADFIVHHFPIQKGSDIPLAPKDVPISYLDMLTEKESIRKIFKTISETDGNILFFCNAGKDRTGVLTALLMMVLGAERKDIIADYLLSSVYMRDVLLNFAKTTDPEIYKVINPKIENMEMFLELFEKRYLSIEKYLFSIGISEQIIKKLYTKLVV